MKVVHSWIRDLVDVPDDVEAISFTLSDIGLAVESVDKVGATVAGVITARVIKTERHPDAAKVHRVFLERGFHYFLKYPIVDLLLIIGQAFPTV